MNQKQQTDNPNLSPGDLYNLLVWAAQVLSTPFDLFATVPGTCGKYYFGGHVVFWMVTYVAAYGSLGQTSKQFPYDFDIYMGFFWAALLMLAVHSAAGRRLQARGYKCHTRYMGRPRLARRENSDELKIRYSWEPLCGFLIAVPVFCASPSLGVMLLIASFARGLAMGHEYDRLRAMQDDMIDAEWEQRQFEDRR